MLRTAERRATSPADDLLDRTGIVAASVPRGRRSPEDTQPIPVVPALLPIAGDGACATVLAPLGTRPRAVARRRTRGWVAATAACALLALGWLAGGLFSGSFLGHTTDDVAVPNDQRELVAPAPAPAPATQQPAPAPAPTPAAPPPTPVTVYVPVPDNKPAAPAKQHVASRPTPPRSEHRPTSAPDDSEARSDTKATSTKSSASEFDEYMAQWKPWIDLADRMSHR